MPKIPFIDWENRDIADYIKGTEIIYSRDANTHAVQFENGKRGSITHDEVDEIVAKKRACSGSGNSAK